MYWCVVLPGTAPPLVFLATEFVGARIERSNAVHMRARFHPLAFNDGHRSGCGMSACVAL